MTGRFVKFTNTAQTLQTVFKLNGTMPAITNFYFTCALRMDGNCFLFTHESLDKDFLAKERKKNKGKLLNLMWMVNICAYCA